MDFSISDIIWKSKTAEFHNRARTRWMRILTRRCAPTSPCGRGLESVGAENETLPGYKNKAIP
jgi:hypothetical protein